MKTLRSTAIPWFLLLIIASSVADAVLADEARRILSDHCYACHGPDESAREAELRFDIRESAVGEASSGTTPIVPGDLERSELIARITADDEDLRMPPAHFAKPLSRQQIETLKEWIKAGAPYDKHWAFTAPVRRELPNVTGEAWPRGAIDRFALARLGQEGLSPQPDAEPTVVARRLSLAITGLPLLPEKLNRFASDYKSDSDAAIDQLVDELLASPGYGEHFGWTWLDAARYADTNGYQADGERQMWPWRDWLIRSLNDNVPFDQMTEHMLAGDLLMPRATRDWESGDWIEDAAAEKLLMATGFLRNHRYDTGSGTIPAESIFENATDRLETVGTVWMGLTFQCARCHTHKFDPIENHEYYELLSYFDNVPEIGSALRNASHPYIHTPTPSERIELERLTRELASAKVDYESASKTIGDAQRNWEQELIEGGEASPIRVRRGLRHHYAERTIQFDGQSTIEKSNDPIALCAGNKEWTISFWFRPEGGQDGAIFSSVEEPERYRPGIQADWIDGRVRVRHVCRWVNSYIEFESVGRVKPGRWYHVTFRCDGRMQGLAYHASLDGDDAAMRCTHPVTNDSAGNAGKAPLVLGGSPLLPSFRGRLRDLRFYDRLVELAEIASLADARTTAEIAQIPAINRNAEDSEILRMAFLECDALPNDVANLRDKVIATSDALRFAVKQLPTTMVMQEAPLGATRVRRMGAYDQLGDAVKPDTPKFLPRCDGDIGSRLELARWLTDPAHPLTARVAVNRIWQVLWGRGFVDSPENFGTQCEQPLHADLLDWLATEYIRLGWDTKALVKLIATSRVYRQTSTAPADIWQSDPENRLLARGPRYRLPVHVVRDQALFLSGRIDSTVGGPPVVLDEVRGKDGTVVKLPYEVSDRRRTLYSFWKRNAPHPMLAVFDVADRNQCDVRVRRTNTPLQALVTLNEPGLASCARELGKRTRSAKSRETDQLSWLWQACCGRQPTGQQLEKLQTTLASYREIAGSDSNSDEAAWLALCNVLLNLDMTLTLE